VTPILADVGVPMIFLQMPLMVAALVPVVFVEALLVRRWLRLPRGTVFAGVAVANLASTLLGVPLAWLAMLAVEFIVGLPLSLTLDHLHSNLNSPVLALLGCVIGSAWLPPAETQMHWMIPMALTSLLVASFFASVWLERLVCVRWWQTSDATSVRRAVFKANLASYLVLFTLACGWTCVELLPERLLAAIFSVQRTVSCSATAVRDKVIAAAPSGWRLTDIEGEDRQWFKEYFGDSRILHFALLGTASCRVDWAGRNGQAHKDYVAKECLHVWVVPGDLETHLPRLDLGGNLPRRVLLSKEFRVYGYPDRQIVKKAELDVIHRNASVVRWPEVILSWKRWRQDIAASLMK